MAADVLNLGFAKDLKSMSCLASQETVMGRKDIVICQVCIRCAQQFPFTHGRKCCPHCSGLLIVKTTVRRRA